MSCGATFSGPSRRTNCDSSISRSSRSTRRFRFVSRHCCAGTIRAEVCCRRPNSTTCSTIPKSAADIGKWVVVNAVRQAAAWSLRGLDFGRLAVNVTSADFALGTFAEFVRDELQLAGVQPQRLCIEVTERVFLGRSADGVAVALQKLHDIGVEIALDDFGTGFGSLSHLKKLPIDRLKVDRSFVRDMETNPDNMAIVRTITHLGQSLGIKVTVEGVETQSQMTLLRAMGCDTMQGYLFAKPMDAAQVDAFLATKYVRRA